MLRLNNLPSRTKDTIAVIALGALGLLTHLPWLRFTQIFTSGDWWYIAPQKYQDFLHFSPIWVADNLGSTSATPHYYLIRFFEALLTSLGSNFAINEKLFYMLPIVIIAPVGAYLLARSYVSRPLALLAGIVYAYNTPFLFNQVGPLTIEMVYALAPLFLYTFRRLLLWPDRIATVILAALLFGFMTLFELRMSLLVACIASGLAVFQFATTPHKRLYVQGRVKALLLFGVVALGTQLFWVLPYAIASRAVTFSDVLARGLFVSFSDITNALTLSHPFWTGFRPATFLAQPVPLLAWIVPLLAFLGVILVRRDRTASISEFYYWIIISLIGIFLVKQVNPPFIDAYAWLFDHLPGFGGFRESSKFYLFIAVGYSLLIPIGLDLIIQRWRQSSWRRRHQTIAWGFVSYLPVVLIAGYFLWNAKPLITGDFRTLITPRAIPTDYTKLNAFLTVQTDFSRILWVPTDSRWGLETNQHPKLTPAALQSLAWMPQIQTANSSSVTARDKLDLLLQSPQAPILLGRAAVKYIVVPLRDLQNEDDFFQYYGNDRSHYIDALASTPFLKRLASIDTGQIAVFENTAFQPYVTAHTQTQAIDPGVDITSLTSFITSQLHQIPNLLLPSPHSAPTSYPAQLVRDLFANIEPNQLAHDSLVTQFDGRNSDLYYNTNNKRYSLSFTNQSLKLFANPQLGLQLNSHPLGPSPTPQVVASQPVDPTSDYYLALDGRISRLKAFDQARSLGGINNSLRLYRTAATNLLTNPSFESGLWQSHVMDCNNYNDNSELNMALSNDATEGHRALRLDTSTHTACTTTRLQLPPPQVGSTAYYLVSFDYQLTGTNDGGYQLTANGPHPQRIKRYIKAYDQDWHTERQIIALPADATTADLLLFGYPNYLLKGGASTLYDHITIQPLVSVLNLDSQVQASYIKLELKAGINTLTYPGLSGQNLISNPSFEQGMWQAKVGDCNSYDDHSVLSMRRSMQASAGRQSLELSATTHAACTNHAPIPVSESQTYALSFDYQSPNAAAARYHISFDGPSNTSLEQTLPIKGTGWQTYSTQVKAPLGATQMTIVVYADAVDNRHPIINRYDNFLLVPVPDLVGQYYQVQKSDSNLRQPANVAATNVRPTKKIITVRGATTSFYLSLSESYNPLWRLEFANAKTRGWRALLPPLGADAIPKNQHIKLNDFENDWYINLDQLCRVQHLCQANPDGSYDLQLMAEFTPQRWFYVGLGLTAGTLICAIIILVSRIRPRPRSPQ